MTEQTTNQKRKAVDEPVDNEEAEEKLCRFCFDGEEQEDDSSTNELISPCNCRGGQKYIHLSCLRQWQRMVLVSQPTHPDFWEDDVRHQKCNVCNADFTCPPPTRQELMLGFTGPEIAALISPGCIIASHESFNRKMEEQMSENNFLLDLLTSVRHWLRGVYLITKVEEDNGEIGYPLEDKRDVTELLTRLDMDTDGTPFLELSDGTKYQLQPEGPLDGANLLEMTTKDLRGLLTDKHVLPCEVTFRPLDDSNTPGTSCTDDKVTAVNLTRPFELSGPLKKRTEKAIQDANAEEVHVTYFKGGPCGEERIVSCLVLGGRRTGYTVVKSFKTALLMAKRNALNARKEGRNNIAVGQDVVLQGLSKRPDLNGKRGLVQAYDESQDRFEVRLLETQHQNDNQDSGTAQSSGPADTIVKKIKPVNLIAHSSGIGKDGAVLAFYGDARWTRVQLLGEIAKTSWGLCRAQTADLFVPPSQLYDTVFTRLVYAPENEMSDDSQRDREDMVALRRGAVEAAQYVQEGEEA